MTKQLPSLLIIFILLQSCGIFNSSKDQPTNENTGGPQFGEATWEEIEDRTTPALYHETRAVLTDILHTKLNLHLDWDQAYLYGIEEISLRPRFYTTDSVFLDAKGMQINSITQNGKALNFAYDSLVLSIALDRAYTRKETILLTIDYIAKPNEYSSEYSSSAISADKGLYFINPKNEKDGYMPQVWTQGETQSSSVWFPTIDSPNMKTTQEIFLTVDNKYVTLSNGTLVSSTKNADGTRTDYWKQSQAHAPYLAMIAVGEFKVVKDFATLKSGRKLDVDYYVEPEWESSARAIFGKTPEMINFFSNLLGVEFPWDKYHQIVVREYVSGAMENTTASVFGDFVYHTEDDLLDKNEESIIAHELFHQWFGDLVTSESWSNLPLNESFANYSQYLWDEYKYGKDEADYNAEKEKKQYISSLEHMPAHNMIWYDYISKEDMFDHHSYAKGGRLLHMLRSHVGDEAFFASLNYYLVNNKFKAAEIHDLRLAFEAVTGKDMNWFFNQWFFKSLHPNVTLQYEWNANKDSLTLVLTNLGVNVYEYPIDVAIADAKGRHVYTTKVLAQDVNRLKFPVYGEMQSVLFDVNQVMLMELEDVKSADLYRKQYYFEKAYTARKASLVKGIERNESSQRLVMDALQDPFWHIQKIALDSIVILSADQLKSVESQIKKIAESASNSELKAKAVETYAKYFSKEQATLLLNAALKTEKSQIVLAQVLHELYQVDPVQTQKLVDEYILSKDNSKLILVAQLYGKIGQEKDLKFYDDLMDIKSLNATQRIKAVYALRDFLTRQDAETVRKGNSSFEKLYKQKLLNVNYVIDAHYSVLMDVVTKLDEIKQANPQKNFKDDKEFNAWVKVAQEYQALIMEEAKNVE